MVEYGYINQDGYLISKFLQDQKIQYMDEDTGETKIKIKSIDEQLQEMDQCWKPVDKVDEKQLIPESPNCSIQIIPYDAGEKISYRYEKIPDQLNMMMGIIELKNKLKSDDYKIIKCYESSLVGEPLPYDIEELHAKRQKIRDEINMLEAQRYSSL